MKKGFGLIGYTAFIFANVYYFNHWIALDQYIMAMFVSVIGIIHYKS